MKLPNFIIAGFGKCGTTALRGALSQHPDVTTYGREIKFFSHTRIWKRGPEWYQRHFSGTCAGEKTPQYVYSRRSMKRMAQTVPEVRLLFCVRNPVDRLYSWYHHKVMRQGYASTQELPFSDFRRFDKVWRYDPLPTGCYARCIRENVLPFFPLDRCLFIVQERMMQDMPAEVGRVHRFLGLPAHPVTAVKRNSTTYQSAMAAETRAELVEYYLPHNIEFYELAGMSIPEWDR